MGAAPKRKAERIGFILLQPPEIRTHAEALAYLDGAFAETLRALVDTLDGVGSKREALLGTMLEDLAELAGTLAIFLGEPNPRPMRFIDPDESMEYLPALRKAVKVVERNGEACPTSLPFFFELWQRAKHFRAREDAARARRA